MFDRGKEQTKLNQFQEKEEEEGNDKDLETNNDIREHGWMRR